MSTNIITTAGHLALKQELDHLWRVYRPEITQKVAWAASLGDRSGIQTHAQRRRGRPLCDHK